MVKKKYRLNERQGMTFDNKQPERFMSQVDVSTKFSEKVSEIEVLATGKWEHPYYGTIEITEDDVDNFIQNFDDKTRKVDIAVDQEHKPSEGAAGWFKSLKKVVQDGKSILKASIEWTGLGKQLLKDGVFKYFSPEFETDYEDQETHDKFPNVLLGGALTNRPYFKSLAPVQLSENLFAGYKPVFTYTQSSKKGGSEMKFTLKELKAKLEADAKFTLPDDADEGQKKRFDEAKAEVAKDVEDKDNAEDEAAQKKAAEKVEADKASESVKGSEQFISKADHAKQMNELKSQMGIVQKQLRFKEVAEQVSSFLFSESNPKGVLLIKNKDKASKILMSAKPEVAKLFTEFLAELAPISAKLFKEEGGDGAGADDKAEALIDEKVKGGMTYSEAVKAVGAFDPDLLAIN